MYKIFLTGVWDGVDAVSGGIQWCVDDVPVPM